MADWNYVAWAADQARENLKARIANGDHLLQQSNNLLTALMAIVAGLCAYSIKVFDRPTPIVWGCILGLLWALGVIWLLCKNCIATRETEIAYNEPCNIYKPELELSEQQIREFDMQNLQTQIERCKQRNAHVATWLDRLRYATVGVVAVIAGSAAVLAGLDYLASSLSALGA